MYRLVFHNGRYRGRRISVQQGDLLIGRDPSCQIDLADDEAVSRRHAILEQRADGVWLRDLGSLNPPTVNGQIVQGEVKLRAGDRIEIGSTLIEFQPVEIHFNTPKRRPSRLQRLAIASVLVILALEAYFIFVLPMRHRPAQQAAAPSKPSEAATPSAPAIQTESPAGAQGREPQAATQPPATVERQSAEPPPAVPDPIKREVEEIKQVISGLREELSAISTQLQTAAVAAPAAHPTPPASREQPERATRESAQTAEPRAREPEVRTETAQPPATPAVPQIAIPERPAAEDPLAARMRELLQLARLEAQKGNWLAADQALERLLILAPDNIPALVERARLYEQRGLLKEAGDVWARLMVLAAGTPLYTQAAAERQRLAREEIVQSMRRRATPEPAQPALPRRIRILAIERERFPGTKEFDEMRLARIVMRPRLGEGRIDVDDLRVWVVFFDRIVGTDSVTPTRARVPETPLRIESAWGAGEQKSVTATYIVPKNFRDEEETETGQRRSYEGVRVQIWYKGVLQDEDAIPKSLLKEEMPPMPPEGSPLAPRPVAARPADATVPRGR